MRLPLNPETENRDKHTTYKLPVAILFIVMRLAGLIFGSNLFVKKATELARSIGVSDKFIATTVLAGGTSIPESVYKTITAQSLQAPNAKFLDGKHVTLSLDVYCHRAESIAYAQLYECSNYTYEPVTKIIELTGDRADKLITPNHFLKIINFVN